MANGYGNGHIVIAMMANAETSVTDPGFMTSY